MPFGSTGTFTDEEWVNGIVPGNGWATFVSRDLVHYVDAHYRTIATARGRAIGGPLGGRLRRHQHRGASSARVLVSSRAGRAICGRTSCTRSSARSCSFSPANDPRLLVRRVAPNLRRTGTYFWFYSGSTDRLRVPERRVRARALGAATAAQLPPRLRRAQLGNLARTTRASPISPPPRRLAHG